MRCFCSAILTAAVLALGCAGPSRRPSGGPAVVAPAVPAPKEPLIVTPETALSGKVVKVNTAGRFVILAFPIGRLPGQDQLLNVYRRGLKVGEVKATGPQLDDNVVADLVAGDAQVGDEVLDR
jgi:hypothetical protein